MDDDDVTGGEEEDAVVDRLAVFLFFLFLFSLGTEGEGPAKETATTLLLLVVVVDDMVVVLDRLDDSLSTRFLFPFAGSSLDREEERKDDDAESGESDDDKLVSIPVVVGTDVIKRCLSSSGREDDWTPSSSTSFSSITSSSPMTHVVSKGNG